MTTDPFYLIIDTTDIRPEYVNSGWLEYYKGVDLDPNDDPKHGSNMLTLVNALASFTLSDNDPDNNISLGYFSIEHYDKYYEGIIAGLKEAVELGKEGREIRIGIPLGYPFGNTQLYNTLSTLPDNITVFIATGNEGSNTASFPARYAPYIDNVISVGATVSDEYPYLAGYSNLGYELLATGSYYGNVGTSVATILAMLSEYTV